MTSTGAALLLSVLMTSAAAAVAGELPKVTLLPLQAEGDVDKATAEGMTVFLRAALERAEQGAVEEPFLELLPEGKGDARRARKCKLKQPCLKKLMKQRGSDLLAAGVVQPSDDDGLQVALLVLEQGGGAPRRVSVLLRGDADAMALNFDRLARLAYAPGTLAGSLQVSGQPAGAEVLVDGKLAGTLPLEGPVLGITEGLHTVAARADGYVTLEKPVRVTFRETTEVKLVLARRSEAQRQSEAEASSSLTGINLWGPSTMGGLAVAAAVGGVVSGGGALWQALEVERRADAQQLIFPRDTLLIRSGQVLAVLANGLYLAAFGLAVGAAGWVGTVFAIDLLLAPGEEELQGPARGAPTADQEPRRREAPTPLFDPPEDEDDDDEGPAKLPSGDGRPR